jgi:predicted nucleotidyltransferase
VVAAPHWLRPSGRCSRSEPAWCRGLAQRCRFRREPTLLIVVPRDHDGVTAGSRLEWFIMELSFPSSMEPFPVHRRRLEAVCRIAVSEPKVLGMLIGGSFASEDADPYSDLDLQFVVEDEEVEASAKVMRRVAERAGPVVAAFFAEHVGLPHMLIVLYRDLIHADFEPVAISRVGSRNAGLASHVLWEWDGIVSSALPANYEETHAADLRWIEGRMWTWSWYVQTKVLRGELYEALDGLQYMRDNVLFKLLAMHREERPSAARRVEARTGEWTEQFADTLPVLSRESMMKALRASMALYQALADPLLHRYGIEEGRAARAVVLNALEAGLTWNPPESNSLS